MDKPLLFLQDPFETPYNKCRVDTKTNNFDEKVNPEISKKLSLEYPQLVSKTGVPGVIFNGVPDFLYETEVLRLDRALWFSPDGQQLLYVTYNDSEVQEHRLVSSSKNRKANLSSGEVPAKMKSFTIFINRNMHWSLI